MTYILSFSLWPSYTVAHNNLATVVDTHDEAEKHLLRALKIDPGHVNSLYNFALLLRYFTIEHRTISVYLLRTGSVKIYFGTYATFGKHICN